MDKEEAARIIFSFVSLFLASKQKKNSYTHEYQIFGTMSLLQTQVEPIGHMDELSTEDINYKILDSYLQGNVRKGDSRKYYWTICYEYFNELNRRGVSIEDEVLIKVHDRIRTASLTQVEPIGHMDRLSTRDIKFELLASYLQGTARTDYSRRGYWANCYGYLNELKRRGVSLDNGLIKIHARVSTYLAQAVPEGHMEYAVKTNAVALMQLNRKFGNRRIVRLIYEYWIGTTIQNVIRILTIPAIVYKPRSFIELWIERFIWSFFVADKKQIQNVGISR